MTRPNYSVQRLPLEDRPRERLARFGAESLSLVELLAIILGHGTQATPVLQLAQELLLAFGGLKGLSEASVQELLAIKGIGHAKAIQIKAALNFGLRASKQERAPRFKIEHPLHAYHLVKELVEHEKREVFVALLQDAKNYFLLYEIISIGSLTQTLVHPREVFFPAIRHKAASFIIAHNHPSGDPAPSQGDIDLTLSLVEAGRLMGIPVVDHLIVGHDTFFSFRQKGYSFE
ncbi:MAG: DNA repair protein RadC [Parachlamydia sp.]|jgi:DNA repair protein RadC|nr:DNA repair protein RadC [Parachlamydia sp.]